MAGFTVSTIKRAIKKVTRPSGPAAGTVRVPTTSGYVTVPSSSPLARGQPGYTGSGGGGSGGGGSGGNQDQALANYQSELARQASEAAARAAAEAKARAEKLAAQKAAAALAAQRIAQERAKLKGIKNMTIAQRKQYYQNQANITRAATLQGLQDSGRRLTPTAQKFVNKYLPPQSVAQNRNIQKEISEIISNQKNIKIFIKNIDFSKTKPTTWFYNFVDKYSGGKLTSTNIDRLQNQLNNRVNSFNQKYGNRTLSDSQQAAAQNEYNNILATQNAIEAARSGSGQALQDELRNTKSGKDAYNIIAKFSPVPVKAKTLRSVAAGQKTALADLAIATINVPAGIKALIQNPKNIKEIPKGIVSQIKEAVAKDIIIIKTNPSAGIARVVTQAGIQFLSFKGTDKAIKVTGRFGVNSSKRIARLFKGVEKADTGVKFVKKGKTLNIEVPKGYVRVGATKGFEADFLIQKTKPLIKLSSKEAKKLGKIYSKMTEGQRKSFLNKIKDYTPIERKAFARKLRATLKKIPEKRLITKEKVKEIIKLKKPKTIKIGATKGFEADFLIVNNKPLLRLTNTQARKLSKVYSKMTEGQRKSFLSSIKNLNPTQRLSYAKKLRSVLNRVPKKRRIKISSIQKISLKRGIKQIKKVRKENFLSDSKRAAGIKTRTIKTLKDFEVPKKEFDNVVGRGNQLQVLQRPQLKLNAAQKARVKKLISKLNPEQKALLKKRLIQQLRGTGKQVYEIKNTKLSSIQRASLRSARRERLKLQKKLKNLNQREQSLAGKLQTKALKKSLKTKTRTRTINQKQRTAQKQLSKVKSKQRTLQKQLQKSNQKISQLLATGLISSSKFAQLVKQVSRQKSKQAFKPAQSSAQVSRLGSRQGKAQAITPRLIQPQLTKQRIRTPLRNKQRLKTIRAKKPIKKGIKSKISKARKAPKRKNGFDVYARPLKKKGQKKQPKLIKVNRVPLTKKRAEDLRNYIADTSLARTAELKPTNKRPQNPKLKIPLNYARVTNKKFRTFRQVKGVRKKLPRGRVIERSRALLDTRQEKKRISLSARIAQLNKPLKKKKVRVKTKSVKRTIKKKGISRNQMLKNLAKARRVRMANLKRRK